MESFSMQAAGGLCLLALGLAGCTGTMRTQTLNPADLGQPGHDFRGVVAFLPGLFLVRQEYTIAKDSEGRVTGRVNDPRRPCISTPFNELRTMADFRRPISVAYYPAWLENHVFKVTLNNGMVESVNAEGQPDRGQTALNLSQAAANFARVAAPLATRDGTPLCNDAPVVTGVFRYEQRDAPPEAP